MSKRWHELARAVRSSQSLTVIAAVAIPVEVVDAVGWVAANAAPALSRVARECCLLVSALTYGLLMRHC